VDALFCTGFLIFLQGDSIRGVRGDFRFYKGIFGKFGWKNRICGDDFGFFGLGFPKFKMMLFAVILVFISSVCQPLQAKILVHEGGNRFHECGDDVRKGGSHVHDVGDDVQDVGSRIQEGGYYVRAGDDDVYDGGSRVREGGDDVHGGGCYVHEVGNRFHENGDDVRKDDDKFDARGSEIYAWCIKIYGGRNCFWKADYEVKLANYLILLSECHLEKRYYLVDGFVFIKPKGGVFNWDYG